MLRTTDGFGAQLTFKVMQGQGRPVAGDWSDCWCNTDKGIVRGGADQCSLCGERNDRLDCHSSIAVLKRQFINCNR